jgi:hypothetical protein
MRWPNSAVSPKSLYGSRRPGTHLAAFSSVGIRPGIPPSSALRSTHLNDANRKGLRRHDTRLRAMSLSFTFAVLLICGVAALGLVLLIMLIRLVLQAARSGG